MSIKAGTHDVQLIHPESPDKWFTTSSKGSDGLLLRFADKDGNTIETALWLTPAAYSRTVQTLKEVFGFKGSFRALADGEKLPNVRATIVCEDEEYTNTQGKKTTSVKVKWINQRGASAHPPADVPKVLDRLARLEERAAETQQDRSDGATDGNGLADDDIPFAKFDARVL